MMLVLKIPDRLPDRVVWWAIRASRDPYEPAPRSCRAAEPTTAASDGRVRRRARRRPPIRPRGGRGRVRRREGDPVTAPEPSEREPGEVVAGYMSAAAIFLGAIGARRTGRRADLDRRDRARPRRERDRRALGPAHAIAVGVRHRRFVLGMTIAVVTGRPLLAAAATKST